MATIERGINALEIVRAVAVQVSAASGVSLVVERVTDETANPTRDAFDVDRYGDRWSPIFVAWSDPATITDLEGGVIDRRRKPGQNSNNRTEEALGQALDVWTAVGVASSPRRYVLGSGTSC